MPRLTKILETYQLSWEDVRVCMDEERWKKRVIDSLALDFQRYCNEEAERYKHPPLSCHTTPGMHPRIRQCLRFGGTLALAALRMRCPHLRVLPDHRPHAHGVCRYCGHGEENGRHIFFCPDMPPALRLAKETIIESILTESGLRSQLAITSTRKGTNALEPYIINFQWPHQQTKTLKDLLVFCRSLINHYAGYPGSWWREPHSLDPFPVHRVRPMQRVAHPCSSVESPDLESA